MAKELYAQAIQDILENCKIDGLFNPIHDIGHVYWAIKIHTGKTKWYLKYINTNREDFKISCLVRYTNDRGDDYSSDAYEVSNGWGRKKSEFNIQQNSTITIAIVRSKYNAFLYPLSRSFADSALDFDYNITLIFRILLNQKDVIPESTKNIFYIRNGELNVL
ncbi:MAG TPA: hypothetical protein VMX96_02035 [Dehalococcoidia bacterium]|nr:hypothetical protein [Dehalococcoidia bacterium]